MNLTAATLPVHDEPLSIRRRLEISFRAQGISLPMRDLLLGTEMGSGRRIIYASPRHARRAFDAFSQAVGAGVIRHEPNQLHERITRDVRT